MRSCRARATAVSPLFEVSAMIIRKADDRLVAPGCPADGLPRAGAARRAASRFCTSICATSMSVPESNVTVIDAVPFDWLDEVMYRKPFDAVQLLLDHLRDVGFEHRGVRAGIGHADRERRRRDRRDTARRPATRSAMTPASRMPSAITQAKTGRSMKKRGVIALMPSRLPAGCPACDAPAARLGAAQFAPRCQAALSAPRRR